MAATSSGAAVTGQCRGSTAALQQQQRCRGGAPGGGPHVGHGDTLPPHTAGGVHPAPQQRPRPPARGRNGPPPADRLGAGRDCFTDHPGTGRPAALAQDHHHHHRHPTLHHYHHHHHHRHQLLTYPPCTHVDHQQHHHPATHHHPAETHHHAAATHHLLQTSDHPAAQSPRGPTPPTATLQYPRDVIMKIGESCVASTPPPSLPDLLALIESLRKTTCTTVPPTSLRAAKNRRRGKRAGILVRLRKRGMRPPLPGIFLSNVCSLTNKMDELRILTKVNKDLTSTAVLCFVETWLREETPDSTIQIEGFQSWRADRDSSLSGKTRGGGICFYVNHGWCSDVTVSTRHCSQGLECLAINCKPFYSPREFASITLLGVYIPPSADPSKTREAVKDLVNIVLSEEEKFPDSVTIILGDFNKANLSGELPRYRQLIKCPTRGGNILDHCYSTIPNAYRAVPRANLGASDHVLVHLIPAYKQKLKAGKPTTRTSKKWTDTAIKRLQGCLECTDWKVLESPNLDDFADAVGSYISFCEEMCIPVIKRVVYNNDKPWFTTRLKHLRRIKEVAFKSGDHDRFKQARYEFRKELVTAKRNYSKKLQKKLTDGDPSLVWRGYKDITNYKPRPPTPSDNPELANNLNSFFCRFDSSPPMPLDPAILTTEHGAVSPPPLNFSPTQVRRVLASQKRKAAGPDEVSALTLRHCATQLSPILTSIFNRSLECNRVPRCYKSSTIVPVPKNSKPDDLNDFRPVALTSLVMKCFERLILEYLKNLTEHALDPLQFAYRANRSVEDAVNMALHYILSHLDSPGTYCRVLFVDFSSAFNTMVPALLHEKLLHLNIPESLCNWINDFLTERSQRVRLGNSMSEPRKISTGAPQGCVLSPWLFSLYTNECSSALDSVKVIKFADDTTVIGLISNDDESAYLSTVNDMLHWCRVNNLSLNAKKTTEMVIDFRRLRPPPNQISIGGDQIRITESLRFLGIILSANLKWDDNTTVIASKAHQRLFCLRQLKRFHLPQSMLVQFYRATIEPILTSGILSWFPAATCKDISRLQRIIKAAERIVESNLPPLANLYSSRLNRRARKIRDDASHPGHPVFQLLPSGKRLRVLRARTDRLKNGFFAAAIACLNRQCQRTGSLDHPDVLKLNY